MGGQALARRGFSVGNISDDKGASDTQTFSCQVVAYTK